MVQCPKPVLSARRTDAVWSPSPKFVPVTVTVPNCVAPLYPFHDGMFPGLIRVTVGASNVKPFKPVPI